MLPALLQKKAQVQGPSRACWLQTFFECSKVCVLVHIQILPLCCLPAALLPLFCRQEVHVRCRRWRASLWRGQTGFCGWTWTCWWTT